MTTQQLLAYERTLKAQQTGQTARQVRTTELNLHIQAGDTK
jgi:hypothetical protein